LENPLVSIIIPVYGVEDYIGRAIESLQAQTYQNWELFLVDDGSKDRSGKICDDYAAKDERILVIHKENGGAPSARNAAIPLSTGKYLYFMDGDDWAEPEMLTEMVALAEEHGTELLVTGFYIDTYYSDTDKFSQVQSLEDRVYASQQEFREDAYRLFDKNLLYTPWNKLYLAEYIKGHDLLFPDTWMDDFPFNLSVVRDVERVALCSKPYYHFIRQRGESETAKYNPTMYEKREEEDAWMRDLYSYWNIDDPASREMLDRRYIERLIGCVENVNNPDCTLSTPKRLLAIRSMIRTKRAREAVRGAKPHSTYMKIMLLPIRFQWAFAAYLESKVIDFVRVRYTGLFAKLKAGR